MRKGIAEILNEASKLKTKNEKINYLRQNDNVALRMLLKMNFDNNLVWDLPETDPPYTPCTYLDQEGMLYNEIRRMYLFHKGGNNNLSQHKREHLFIQMLESLAPADAKLVLGVKKKKLPYKGLTKNLINEAFPGLLVY